MFAAYTVRGEGLSGEVVNLVMYLIVMCNYDTSVVVSERVTHRQFLQGTVSFPFKVGGLTL